MIIVLLDRMIATLRTQDLDDEQRRELSLRARKIEGLFVEIQEIVEIQNEADLNLEELTARLDLLTEVISHSRDHRPVDRAQDLISDRFSAWISHDCRIRLLEIKPGTPSHPTRLPSVRSKLRK
jgi:hypothetical protein